MFAGGGEAGPFGQIQQGNAPRIVSVNSTIIHGVMYSKAWLEKIKTEYSHVKIPQNGFSNMIYTGSLAGDDRYVSFESSGGEQRCPSSSSSGGIRGTIFGLPS